MDVAAEFRRCLETLDVKGIRRLSAHAMPHLPQCKSDGEALASLHMARTQAEWLRRDLRFYSHRWLTERGLPSQLPDQLRPSAEQAVPKQVTAVGLSFNFRSADLKPAAIVIRAAMNEVIENCYADGREEPDYITPRMNEARDRERRALFGRWMT